MKSKKLLCVSLVLLLSISFLPTTAFAHGRPAALLSYEYDYYIPVDGTQGDVAQNPDTYPGGSGSSTGTIYGWGLIGADGADHEMLEGSQIGLNVNKTYNIELDSETPSDAKFDLVVDCADNTGTRTNPYVNTMPGLASIPKGENVISTPEKGYKFPVILVNGMASANLYASEKIAPVPEVTYTFNFTIAEPDSSDDPLPESVESIEIVTPPNKTTYFDGGKFDRVGMVVTATLKEGGVIPVNGYTITPETLMLDTTEVTITFGDGEHIFNTAQAITVLPSTRIGNVEITNGQLLGDIYYDGLSIYEKKNNMYDAVVLHGQEKANITFDVGNGAQVYIGDAPQPITDGVCALSLDASKDGTLTLVTLKSGTTEVSYKFTMYQQMHSGMPTRVVDYLCIASQYTNGSVLGPYGMNPISTLRGNRTSATSTSTSSSPVSLGNFGGYITYYYEAAITDDAKNPYGIDFIVFGNSHNGGSEFAEPGNVLVSEDGEIWYTLAGSLHYDNNAWWPYSITYTKNGAGRSEWTDSTGYSGVGDKYPAAEHYSLFPWTPELERSITLSGVLLAPEIERNAWGNIVPPYPDFGYADVGIISTSNVAANPYGGLAAPGETRRTDGFDLKWAVDGEGSPIDLSTAEIRYVKIQSANNINSGGGGIGEKSTEIHMMRTAAPAISPVGVTDAPISITVDGTAVTIPADNGVVNNVPVSGPFVVSVNAHADANIYINGSHGTEATFAGIPNHEMLRIIVQEAEKEPWIAYLKLLQTGEDGKYSVITFNPDGGAINGASQHTYTPETTDKAFPTPEWQNRTFLGWYDASGKKYDSYAEDMPAALTLTAKWQYNVPQGESTALNVSFRLVGATKSQVMGEGENRNTDIDLGDQLGYKGSEYKTWIATKSYTMQKGDTMRELFVKALADAGLATVGAERNYVSSVTAPAYYGGYELKEFTNGQRSGWMYTVGNPRMGIEQRHPDRGLLQYDLQDGDVVIWHYVNDYAYEVEDWFEDDEFPSLATDSKFYSKWLEAEDRDPPRDGSVAPGTGQDGGADKPGDRPSSGGASLPDKVTELTVKAEVKDNIATVAVKADEVTAAVETAKKDGSTAVSVKVTGVDNAKAAEVSLPKASVNELKAAGLELVVDTPVAAIALDGATLTAIAETAKDGETIKIAAETVDTAASLNDKQREKVGDNPVIEVNISVGTTAITNLGGTVTVSVLYTPPATVAETDQDLLTVYYLDDDGNITEMKGAHYDAATGKITFATNHFSKFFISEWINPFDDIAKGEWYYKAARYAYSNALITGTTDTTFAPQATLTRAMLATILYRNAVGGGVPDAPPSPETPFTDVASGQWYTPAIAWASSNGLITGVGDNKFAPNDPITREQFATLLYRYTQWSAAGNGTPRAASPTDEDLSAYTDAETISDWAQEAMAWAVANGLVTGRTETTLAPQIPANRAEAAMLLQRYLENTK